ncbi:Protein required for normal rRNA processing [Trachipleistophora hominis]|uniref:Protein required for normal rRNA processing n=1 Tax=Trachipleistophora hominis TaxID=72359 RepID=L7JX18_TRAHO|nr:Protein required for normal rRNA processing [Trachipleistophora hominis]
MGGRLKIQKTHISMQKACEELKVTKEQFKELIIHLNIHAESVRSIYKLSCSDANTYSLKDVNKIYNSKLYATIQKNNQRELEKKTWRRRNRNDIADKMRNLDYDYVNIISSKYRSFSDAVADLGETLTFLYVYQFFSSRINDEEGISEIIRAELAKFEKFMIDNTLIKSVYPTKKGLHVLLRINVVEILFFVPLNSNFTDIKRNDFLPYIKLYMYHLMMVNCRMKNVKIDTAKDVVDEREYENEDNGRENAKETKKDSTYNHDHVKNDGKESSNAINIFQNLKIFIGETVLAHWLEILCLCAGAEISEECDYYVTEGKISYLNGSVAYVYPSFIINSYNRRVILDKDEYLVGKEPVGYHYPFESHDKKYDKDFIDTLSKTKRKNVSEYLESIQRNTYFS